MRVFKLLLFFLSFAHYFGCVMYFVSLKEVARGAPDAWIIHGHDYLIGDKVPISLKYARSLYWALESLTLGCHGDILPQNSSETVMAIFCALTGFVIVSTVIGNISDLLATLDKAAAVAQAKVDTFMQYANIQDLPNDLRETTIRYYDFKNSYTRGIDVIGVFEMMPNSFKSQIAKHLYGDLLSGTYIFSGVNSGLMTSIAMLMKPQFFTPGDLIINQGDFGTELLVINYGMAEVISVVDQCVYAVLNENDICGEISFFIPSIRRTASVKALSYCELLSLTRKEWDMLSSGMDELNELIQQKVQANYEIYSEAHLNIKYNMTEALNNHSSKLRKLITDPKAVIMVDNKIHHNFEKRVSISTRIWNTLCGCFRQQEDFDLSHMEGYAAPPPSEGDKKSDSITSDGSKEDRKKTRRSSLERRQQKRQSAAALTEDNLKISPPSKRRSSVISVISGNDRSVEDLGNSLILQKQKLRRTSSQSGPNGTSNLTNKTALSLVAPYAPPYPWGMPDSFFRNIWEVLILCMSIYYVIVIPFRICFLPDDDSEWEYLANNIILWMNVERISDILLLINIVLKMRFFAFSYNSVLVTNPSEVSNHYIHTELVLDIIMLLPIDYLQYAIGEDSHHYTTITWLRVNKLSYFFRIHSSFKTLEKYASSQGLSFRPSSLRFAIFIFYFILLNHWIGCVYYLAGMSSGGYGSYIIGNDGSTLKEDGAWMSVEGSMFNKGETYSDVTLVRAYLRSFYFSLGTVITVAYGDIKVLTDKETLVVIFVIVIACFFLGSLIGVHRANLTDIYVDRSHFSENLNLSIWLLKNRKFDDVFLSRVKSYYSSLWERRKGMDNAEILADLPTSLRTEIALYNNFEIIEKVELFENLEQTFIDAIALALKPQILEGIYIFSQSLIISL